MASQGPLSATAGANQTGVGSVAWSNPGNIISSNDSRAIFGANNTTSNYLVSSSHGFTIPSGATIDGIIVEVEKSLSVGAANAHDNIVSIVKGGSIGATNKADTVTAWSTTEAYTTYGTSSDIWGETWTDTDINAAGFGVAISAIKTDVGAVNMRVDHIRITVHYTTGAGGNTTNFFQMF